MADCIFCKIVEGTLPTNKLYEDDQVVAFADINPQAPVHLLVIPKRHVLSLDQTAGGDGIWLGHMLLVCAKIAKEQGLSEKGYRVVANTGREAGQTVFHLHFHVMGGRPFSWPPG